MTGEARATVAYPVQNRIETRPALMAVLAFASGRRKRRRRESPDLHSRCRSTVQRFAAEIPPCFNCGNIGSGLRVSWESQRQCVGNGLIPAGLAPKGDGERRHGGKDAGVASRPHLLRPCLRSESL